MWNSVGDTKSLFAIAAGWGAAGTVIASDDEEAGQPPPETNGSLSSLDFIRQIAASDADVNRTLAESATGLGLIDYHGATPLLLTCKTDDVPMMKPPVELGADPETTPHLRTMPLMAAAGLACSAPDEEPSIVEGCATSRAGS